MCLSESEKILFMTVFKEHKLHNRIWKTPLSASIRNEKKMRKNKATELYVVYSLLEFRRKQEPEAPKSYIQNNIKYIEYPSK